MAFSSIFNLKMGYNTSIPFEVNLRDDGECININGRKLNLLCAANFFLKIKSQTFL